MTTTAVSKPPLSLGLNPLNIEKVKIDGNRIIAIICGNQYEVEVVNKEITELLISNNSNENASSRKEMLALIGKVCDYLEANSTVFNSKKNASVELSDVDITVKQEGAVLQGLENKNHVIETVKNQYKDITINPLNPCISKSLKEKFSQYVLPTDGGGRCGAIALHDQIYQIKGKVTNALHPHLETNQKVRDWVADSLLTICNQHQDKENLCVKLESNSLYELTIAEQTLLNTTYEAIKTDYKKKLIDFPGKYKKIVTKGFDSLNHIEKILVLRYWTQAEDNIRGRIVNSDGATQTQIASIKAKRTSTTSPTPATTSTSPIASTAGLITMPGSTTSTATSTPSTTVPTSTTATSESELSHAETIKVLKFRANQYRGPSFWVTDDFFTIAATFHNTTIAIIATDQNNVPYISETFPTNSSINVDKIDETIFIKSNIILDSSGNVTQGHYESINRTKEGSLAFLQMLVKRHERSKINEFSENINKGDKSTIIDRLNEQRMNLSKRSNDYYAQSMNYYNTQKQLNTTLPPIHTFAQDQLNANTIWKNIESGNFVSNTTNMILQEANSKAKSSTLLTSSSSSAPLSSSLPRQTTPATSSPSLPTSTPPPGSSSLTNTAERTSPSSLTAPRTDTTSSSNALRTTSQKMLTQTTKNILNNLIINLTDSNCQVTKIRSILQALLGNSLETFNALENFLNSINNTIKLKTNNSVISEEELQKLLLSLIGIPNKTDLISNIERQLNKTPSSPAPLLPLTVPRSLPNSSAAINSLPSKSSGQQVTIAAQGRVNSSSTLSVPPAKSSDTYLSMHQRSINIYLGSIREILNKTGTDWETHIDQIKNVLRLLRSNDKQTFDAVEALINAAYKTKNHKNHISLIKCTKSNKGFNKTFERLGKFKNENNVNTVLSNEAIKTKANELALINLNKNK